MQPIPVSPSSDPEAQSCTLRYFVAGMDCATCASKVEKMLERTPGAGERKILFSSETLEVKLDESRSSRATLEQNLRSLGYEPSLKRETRAGQVVERADVARGLLQSGEAEPRRGGEQDPYEHVHTLEESKPWYAGRQGKLVLSSGVLLLLAYGFGFLEPQLAYWGYVAATLVGVYPLLRQSLAAWRFGDYFGINTLVAVAALGAIAIKRVRLIPGRIVDLMVY